LGALTEPLAAQAKRVIAVEVDRGIAALLEERMRPFRNVEVRHGDILEFPWAEVPGAIVVGAIPYQITSPILMALSDQRGAIRRAVLVLQEEVASRLLAEAGTKAYGRLSVLAQYAWEVSSRLTVPRSAFFPQPDVDSRCLRLQPRAAPVVPVRDEARFFELVKRAFAHRRKTLANCLSGSGALSRAQVEAALRALGHPASIRGEALTLEQFAALAEALAGVR
jgi:16S rRNA (adenine1518-N6/adenine1519-N6)-dimethyltransferase